MIIEIFCTNHSNHTNYTENGTKDINEQVHHASTINLMNI